MPEGRYRPLLCLVQIAVGDEIALLDPLGRRSATRRRSPRCSPTPAVEVVLHAGRQDVAILRRAVAAPTFTTSSTRRSPPGSRASPPRRATPGCCTTCCAIRLAEVGELHALGRAAADAGAAPLRARGRRAPAAARRRAAAPPAPSAAGSTGRARSAGAIEEATDERDPEEVWRRLPRISGLDPRERAVARELAAWRERTAAAEDRPVGAVLRDPTLVELAKRQPHDRRALAPDPRRQARRLQRRRAATSSPRSSAAARPSRSGSTRASACATDPVDGADDRARRVARPRPRAGGRPGLRADRRARRPRADRRRRPARRSRSPTCARCAAGGASSSARSCWSCSRATAPGRGQRPRAGGLNAAAARPSSRGASAAAADVAAGDDEAVDDRARRACRSQLGVHVRAQLPALLRPLEHRPQRRAAAAARATRRRPRAAPGPGATSDSSRGMSSAALRSRAIVDRAVLSAAKSPAREPVSGTGSPR